MPQELRERIRRLEARRERFRRQISRLNLILARLELQSELGEGTAAGPLVFRANHGTLTQAPKGVGHVERSRGG